MKNPILLFIFWMLIHGNLFAQKHQNHIDCGTEVSPEEIEFRKAYEAQFPELKPIPINKSLGNVIPIKAHLFRQDNGAGGLSVENLMDAIEILNEHYIQTTISFELCGGIDLINNTDLYHFNRNPDEDFVFNNHYSENVTETSNIEIELKDPNADLDIFVFKGCGENAECLGSSTNPNFSDQSEQITNAYGHYPTSN